jgi:hypothetical protein
MSIAPSSDIPLGTIFSSPSHSPTLRLVFPVGRVCSDACKIVPASRDREGKDSADMETERNQEGNEAPLRDANGDVDMEADKEAGVREAGGERGEESGEREESGESGVCPCFCQWKVWVNAEDGSTKLTGKVEESIVLLFLCGKIRFSFRYHWISHLTLSLSLSLSLSLCLGPLHHFTHGEVKK